MPIYQGNQKDQQGGEVSGTMYSHFPETGDYITATDICTLMLYARFTKWQQHLVISENFVFICNCISNQLAVLPRQVWEQMGQNSIRQ